ncbi:LysR family transcriptional regulator ArgP [uncultured Roseobacter sp.]|uniref:LysR family transcriptional regulator ArgP n=1 Tax=uncultured Roseobacter sp. TaxID=114847 RepID=UPI002630C382|nr:LysR family transcriptional regulator ArgP [uncultured Roseobacter sp.]
MILDPAQLAALSAIVRHGSFEGAAAQLNVTPSAISQRIKALEERMGAILIYRGTPCTPTDAGTRLARHADDVTLLETQVLQDIAPDTNRSAARIRIAVNADSLATWFVSGLSRNAGTFFELLIDDQDYSTDWLLRGAVSAAITGQAQAAAGCSSTALGALRYVATASPAFVARWFDDGVTPRSLVQTPMMNFDAKDNLQHRWIRNATGEKLTPPAHHLPSTHAFVDACLLGLGWGLNPLSIVQRHLDDGTLVTLMPDCPLDVPLYWQTSRLMAKALEPLSKSIFSAAREQLVNIPHERVKQKY